MRGNAVLTLALAAALGAGAPIAAGAYLDTAAAQTGQQTFYTDAELESYVEASREIEPISSRIARMTPRDRQQATERILSILRRHRLTGDQYNAIEAQTRSDPALAQRVAAIYVQDLDDDTLRRFVAAAADVDPISRSLTAEATEAQREQASNQIREVLERRQISAALYNAIAARAQVDQTLAARIAQLQSPPADAASPPAGD